MHPSIEKAIVDKNLAITKKPKTLTEQADELEQALADLTTEVSDDVTKSGNAEFIERVEQIKRDFTEVQEQIEDLNKGFTDFVDCKGRH